MLANHDRETFVNGLILNQSTNEVNHINDFENAVCICLTRILITLGTRINLFAIAVESTLTYD